MCGCALVGWGARISPLRKRSVRTHAFLLCSALLLLCLVDGVPLAKPAHPHHAQYRRASEIHYFKPDLSSTFRSIPTTVGGVHVDYKYADGSALIGFDGQDVVSLGDYDCLSRIAGIKQSNSGDFDDVSGILGFGFSSHPRNPALLYTMSRPTRADWNLTQPSSMHLLSHRVFALLSNRTHGELHLGGYDPSAASGPITFVPMPLALGYGVIVTSVKYGGVELFNFEPGYTNFTAILDSGTTCLVFPETTVNGTFSSSPYGLFSQASKKKNESITITLETGFVLEFPYKDWHDDSCVSYLDTGMLLGNLLFRRYLTVFDVDHYTAGFGRVNPSYRFGVGDGHSGETSGRHWSSLVVTEPQSKLKRRVTKLDVWNYQRSQFHIRLSVGTPPQSLPVIFDTGSYMLAIFSHQPTRSRVLGQAPSSHGGGNWVWFLMAFIAIGSLVGIVALKGTIASHRRKIKEALLSSPAEVKPASNSNPEWMSYGSY